MQTGHFGGMNNLENDTSEGDMSDLQRKINHSMFIGDDRSNPRGISIKRGTSGGNNNSSSRRESFHQSAKNTTGVGAILSGNIPAPKNDYRLS